MCSVIGGLRSISWWSGHKISGWIRWLFLVLGCYGSVGMIVSSMECFLAFNGCYFLLQRSWATALGYAGARGLAHLDIWFRAVCVLGRYLPFMCGANVNYSLCGVCRGCSHFLFLNAITQLSCAFEGGKGSYCIAMAHSPWAVLFLIPSNLGLLFSDGNIRSWQHNMEREHGE